jgi:hypothetical protein
VPDLLDPDAVLGSAAVQRLIDWSQPVGVLAVAVAYFIPDVDPGVVPTWQWLPRPSGFASDDADPFTLALVARKP